MSRKPHKRRFRRRKSAPHGAPPGTLLEHPDASPSSMKVVTYGPDHVDIRAVADANEVQGLLGRTPVVWLRVQGLGGLDTVRAIGATFGIHELALEDIVNVHQRPKVEEYDEHLFAVARLPADSKDIVGAQVSIVFGAGFVVTFEETAGNALDLVERRLERAHARIRTGGADYLAYRLIDVVTDAYFPILERYGERVESLEEEVLAGADGRLTARIHDVKRDLLTIRRTVWPHRDMVNELVRSEAEFVSERTKVHLRDCYDHTIQIMDLVETYREVASDLVDLYLSKISARMNEIMQTLTIIATIFMPLAFIASVYGMNFDARSSPWNMPELAWYFGYPFALALMAAVAGIMLVYFYRKRWILSGSEPGDTNRN